MKYHMVKEGFSYEKGDISLINNGDIVLTVGGGRMRLMARKKFNIKLESYELYSISDSQGVCVNETFRKTKTR